MTVWLSVPGTIGPATDHKLQAQGSRACGWQELVLSLMTYGALQSVAHMPMKAMIYKSLSTVVDDFFAWVLN